MTLPFLSPIFSFGLRMNLVNKCVMVGKVPGQRLNCYLFVVDRSPSTDDRVFYCLSEAMGSIQSFIL